MADREPRRTAPVLENLRRHARDTPERIAFTFLHEDGREESLAFGELAARVDALGGALATLAGPGARAMLLYPPGLGFVVAFFACLRAGLVAVPAPLPRKHGNRQFAALLRDASPALVLSTREAATTVAPQMEGQAACLICTDGFEAGYAAPSVPPKVNNAAVAFIQYTSGSTSAPRGVEVSHANLAANVEAIGEAFGFHRGSVMVSWLPPFHDMGLVGSIVAPAALGFRSVLMAPATFLRRPLRWLEAIAAYGATCAGAPDFAWDLCARRWQAGPRMPLDLSRLELAYNGAEPVRAATLRRMMEAFAGCGLRPEALFACYGLAEHTLLVSGGPRGRAPRILGVSKARLEAGQVREAGTDDPDARELVSCGPPAPGVTVLAVDADSGRPAGMGRVGEIWLAGDSVARAYHGAHAASGPIFGARLADGGGPWLRTGDLGFVREGELYVTGRLKDLVIINGRNIYPQDVEALVEETAPFLEPNRCAAFALEEGGRERLAIVLEADRHLVRVARRGLLEGASIAQLDALSQRLRTAVARRFGVAAGLLAFVRPGSFPRTTSGKVQRARCKALALEGALDVVYASREMMIRPQDASRPQRRRSDPPAPDDSRERASALLAWLRQYAQRRLDSRLMDERRAMPPHVLLDFGNQGLLGLQAPPSLGGRGLATTDLLRVMEQLAAIDLTLATTVGVHNGLGLRPLLRFGPDALRARLAPGLAAGRQLAAFALTEPAAGANPLAMRTRALRVAGGWRLSGEKHLIGLAGWAGWITVLARAVAEDGAALGTVALLVPEDAPGLRQEAEALTMGMRAMVQNALRFEDVFVPDAQVLGRPGSGMEVARDAMAFARLGIGALCVGAMKRCAQLMLRYAVRRDVAGGRLADNPVTLARLDELSCAIAALESLVQAIGALDAGGALPQEACMACKCVASELLWEAADRLMQLLGGRGYLEPNLAPQLLRDARVMRILEGPTEALYAHLAAAEQACLGFVDEMLGAPAFAEPVRAALRVAGPDAAHAAGELCAWTMLAAAAPRGSAAAAWARGRFESMLAAFMAQGRRSAPFEELAQRVAAYAAAIGEPDQDGAGEAHGCDPLLAREWAAAAPAAAAEPAAALATRELVRECVLNGLREAGVNEIGDDTSFAEAGLDSLAAMPVALELEQRTGLAVNAELLYEFPTVAQLAAYVDARRDARRDAGKPARQTDAGEGGDAVE
ncbi:AMP-binding protein [Massilia sp. ZL223]|uniref:AMP-binding protein n=1 Tax=Massilia sp. ZL223 TaxID=2824904 RepID=UPI001B832BC3|nr:AMP-binding protein [Massilia sp. ZL223]